VEVNVKMPLYEYRCVTCDAVEEKLCSYSSPEEYDCPVCGRAAGMRRQLSVPAIAFAGGGWYAQGYSDSPPCKTEKASGDESAKSPRLPSSCTDKANGALAKSAGRCEGCSRKGV